MLAALLISRPLFLLLCNSILKLNEDNKRERILSFDPLRHLRQRNVYREMFFGRFPFALDKSFEEGSMGTMFLTSRTLQFYIGLIGL